MPFFMKIDNLTLVHGGITNEIDLDVAKKKKLERVLYIRNIDSEINTLWSEVYDGNQGVIVYGHNGFDEVRIDQFSIGIDTGCVYGNKLSAVVIEDTLNPLENHTIVDVKAEQTYTQKRGDEP